MTLIFIVSSALLCAVLVIIGTLAFAFSGRGSLTISFYSNPEAAQSYLRSDPVVPITSKGSAMAANEHRAA